MINSNDIDKIITKVYNNEPVEVINYNVKPYSKDKLGFLSDHQCLEIKVKRNNTNEIETQLFFVKVLPESSDAQRKFITSNGLFEQESEFFNCIVPRLQEKCISDNWCPKCYLANDRIIVLEDLRTRGFTIQENKILEGDRLRSAVRAQARLHAASILTEKRLGKRMIDVSPKACKEFVYTSARLKQGRFELFVDLGERIAKRIGIDHRRIYNGLSKGFLRLLEYDDKINTLNRVVCHGDTWPNNYLFDTKDPTKCLLVDFQLCRYAPRTYDVAQLIYLSTTPDIRRTEERETIEAYYAELCETLKRNDPLIEVPSYQDILGEYESVRLTAMYAAIAYYPIITLSKGYLDIPENDLDQFHKNIMFRTDNDLVVKICDYDKDYELKMNGLVQEIVDYCQKLDIPVERDSAWLDKELSR